ncbi:MAG: SDR family NAD(P)-dependent oxidoreductase [Thermodesulfobacteriota bacterium]|nr:MAG: SDR family NAD(P)-dependent oxidoreductase [Thermodesulfobacteriota bacterium]
MKLSGKRVLVTGACGFIGSHLVERLLEEGSDVRALVCYNSMNSWGWLDRIPSEALKSVEVVSGDIRDPHGVRKAIEGSEVVLHLAALIGIPYSYRSPESYMDTNIKGTLNVLQAARDFSIERVVVTSTSEVYGTAMYAPIDEEHPRQAQSPYAATKIAADSLAESFVRSFGQDVLIARPFNTYGPRQSARAIIPTIITQLLSGNRALKLGALHPTRDFVYVKDTVEGFVRIAKSGAKPGTDINIATGQEISVRALAETIAGITGEGAEIKRDDNRVRVSASEVERLCGSVERLKGLTGWAPMRSLGEGLRETVEWFSVRENLNGYKHGIYNI